MNVMKYFIIFYFYLSLAHGGIIKTTERSEPIDTTTAGKMLNATVKDESTTSEKSVAQTRDEEATIMLAHDTLLTASDIAELKSDLQMADGERSGKLLLLSTPKLTEKNSPEGEQDENVEESATWATEMKAEDEAKGTDKNLMNNKKDNMPVMPTLSKIHMEGNENLKEMEKSLKREIQVDAPASNARVYHLDHDESLDYVLVLNDGSHASHVLESDLHPEGIVESAHFVSAPLETEIH